MDPLWGYLECDGGLDPPAGDPDTGSEVSGGSGDFQIGVVAPENVPGDKYTMLNQAVNRAVRALQDPTRRYSRILGADMSCADLFNGATYEGQGPADVLAGAITAGSLLGLDAQTLVNTSPIAFLNTGIAGPGAQYNAVTQHGITQGLFTGTLVSINTNPGTFYGVGRGIRDHAETIIHELGHIMFRLSGGTGYIQPNDTDPGSNRRNSDMVREVCRF